MNFDKQYLEELHTWGMELKEVINNDLFLVEQKNELIEEINQWQKKYPSQWKMSSVTGMSWKVFKQKANNY